MPLQGAVWMWCCNGCECDDQLWGGGRGALSFLQTSHCPLHTLTTHINCFLLSGVYAGLIFVFSALVVGGGSRRNSRVVGVAGVAGVLGRSSRSSEQWE